MPAALKNPDTRFVLGTYGTAGASAAQAMSTGSVAEILALRIRASLERDFQARDPGLGHRAPAGCGARGGLAGQREGSAQPPPGAAEGWGTRPLRRGAACGVVVDRRSLGWGTRPI